VWFWSTRVTAPHHVHSQHHSLVNLASRPSNISILEYSSFDWFVRGVSALWENQRVCAIVFVETTTFQTDVRTSIGLRMALWVNLSIESSKSKFAYHT
jgi:hypothetical protein